MPRHAAIESSGSDEKFAHLVEEADIIYFPSEAVALSSRSETAWRLVEALRRNGNSFALGWDLRAEEDPKHRGFFTEAAKSGAEVLALHPPAELAPDDISRGFEPPPGDFERFAQRLASRHVSEVKLRAIYEAELLAEQFAAEKIATYFRNHRSEKMLVFLREDQLGPDHGVPYFVSQKTKARQLILNPKRHSASGPGLLARN